MKLFELTAHLQNLCHEGYSNDEVFFFDNPFSIPINSIKRIAQPCTTAGKKADNKGSVLLEK